jgi:hypothetical protein
MPKETLNDRMRGEAHGGCDPQVVDSSGEHLNNIEHESTDIFLYGGNIAAACMATNAVARPQVDLTDEEQRTMKLQMNRTNAQRNRDRKRMMVDILQAESDQLTKSNMELKNQNLGIRKVIDIVKQQLKKRGEQHSIQISPAMPQPKKQKVKMRVEPLPRLPPLLSSTATGSRGGRGLFLGGQQASAQYQAKSYLDRDILVDAMARDIVIREQRVLREQLLANMLDNQQATYVQQQPGVITTPQRLNSASLSSSSRLDPQARPTSLPSSENTGSSILASHLRAADGILQVNPSVVLGFQPPFSLVQQSNLLKLLRRNDLSGGGPAVTRPSDALHRRPERTSYDLLRQVSAPAALLSDITPREAGSRSSSGGSSNPRSSVDVLLAAASASYVATNTLELLAQQKGNLFQ